MNYPQISDAIPLIGTTLGGIVIGVFAANGFTALGWELDWETLAAGGLGLTGGWLAYKAATDHRRATERRNAFIFKVKHLKSIETAELTFAALSEVAFESNNTDFNREVVESAVQELTKVLSFPEPLPLTISEKIATCSDWLTLFDVDYNETAIPPDSDMPPEVFTLWNLAGNLSDTIKDLKETVGRYYAHR